MVGGVTNIKKKINAVTDLGYLLGGEGLSKKNARTKVWLRFPRKFDAGEKNFQQQSCR